MSVKITAIEDHLTHRRITNDDLARASGVVTPTKIDLLLLRTSYHVFIKESFHEDHDPCGI